MSLWPFSSLVDIVYRSFGLVVESEVGELLMKTSFSTRPAGIHDICRRSFGV